MDERVVSDEIDEIGGDEGKSDRADHVHTLESAAQGEIEKERKHAGGECAHVGSGEDSNRKSDTEASEIVGKQPDRNREKGSDGQAKVDAVDEGSVAVFAAARSEGLGDQGVEADEEAFAEEGEHDEKTGGDADGPDGFGGVGKAADHHGIDEHHAHPADFGEDERKSEAQSGAEFAAEGGEEGHGGVKKISDSEKRRPAFAESYGGQGREWRFASNARRERVVRG